MTWRGDKARRHDEALLVACAERLCADAAAIELRPEFRASLRSTLLAAAPTPPTAPTRRSAERLHTRRRRMAIVSGLVTATLGLAGMVTASANALPGETLYPIKRTAERLELAIHRDLADRGVFHLELAERRLGEATRLFARGGAHRDLGIQALEEFDREAAAGTAALIDAYRTGNSRDSIVILNRFLAKATRQLEAAQSKLVDVTLPQMAQARKRLASIAATTKRLCPDCGDNTLAQTSRTSRLPASPESPPASTRPPAAAGAVFSTNRLPTRSQGSSRGSGESDDSDADDAGSANPLVDVPESTLYSEVPETPADPPDAASDNVIVELVSGVDTPDVPQLDGAGELLKGP